MVARGDEEFFEHPNTPRVPGEQIEFDEVLEVIDEAAVPPALDPVLTETNRQILDDGFTSSPAVAADRGPSRESTHERSSSGSGGGFYSTPEEILGRRAATARIPNVEAFNARTLGDVCAIRMDAGDVYLLHPEEFELIVALKRKPFHFLYEGWTLDGALFAVEVSRIAEVMVTTAETRLNKLRVNMALNAENGAFNALVTKEHIEQLAVEQGISVEEVMQQRTQARTDPRVAPSIIVPGGSR